jgi:hypothetical protein
VGTLITFLAWSLFWGGLGLKLWKRRGYGGSEETKAEDSP